MSVDRSGADDGRGSRAERKGEYQCSCHPEDPQDSRGLPNPDTARMEALARLAMSLESAIDHLRVEAFGDLLLALGTAKEQTNALRDFDRALIDLLPPSERPEANRFVQSRDRWSVTTADGDQVPF